MPALSYLFISKYLISKTLTFYCSYFHLSFIFIFLIKNKIHSINLSMLLQRLYNWIKYKSLPTSFLFKNRLFIERNTKHRRIYSIFGALMRNSKWGNFELSNIKYQFRFNYTRYLLWSFSLSTLFLLSWLIIFVGVRFSFFFLAIF